MPALLTLLPLAALVFVLVPSEWRLNAGLLAIIGTGGGTAFLSQVVRDRGRAKQQQLWGTWGGPPTTRLLRRSEAPGHPSRDRWRSRLQRVTGDPLPTKEDERSDPEDADARYAAAVGVLREATRDRARFPLVAAENANYGFRRNLWGLKPWGVTVALASALGCWGLFASILDPDEGGWRTSLSMLAQDGTTVFRLVGACLSTTAVAGWLLVTPQWVRTTAEAYALQLLGATELLVSAQDPSLISGGIASRERPEVASKVVGKRREPPASRFSAPVLRLPLPDPPRRAVAGRVPPPLHASFEDVDPRHDTQTRR